MHQPDCSSIPSGNETQVENLIVKLFHCSVGAMHPRGKLWPLAQCLFATYLMNLSDMRVKYPGHSTLRTVCEKSNECGTRLEWGATVKNKFEVDNIKAVVDEGGSLLPLMLQRIVILENNVRVHQEVNYHTVTIICHSQYHSCTLHYLLHVITGNYGNVGDCAINSWKA